MPTSAAVRRAVVQELSRNPEAQTIVDAGSGWGTLCQAILGRFPEKRVIGIENSPVPLLAARLLARGRISYVRRSLYLYDYRKADLVVCYLYPGAMKRLSGILRNQLPPGAMVMSICFAMPGWEAERVVTCGDMYRTKIYIYRNSGEDDED